MALPLLLIGLLSEGIWSQVPLLSSLPPPTLLGILSSWSVFELLGSKNLLGQRILQLFGLAFSPFVGALMGIAAAKIAHLDQPLWLIALIGGLLALVLKLVEVGWFFRLRGLPLSVVLLEDALCIVLTIYALKAPENGGLIALILLWLALRTSKEWRRRSGGQRS